MIFIDTSAWVALTDANDRYHGAARTTYARIARGEFGRAVTTNYVALETLTMVRRNLGVEAAERLATAFEHSNELRAFWIEPTHHHDAVRLMLHHKDKQWSIVDCSSFVVMRALAIENAFAFDSDFTQAGFRVHS